MKKVLLLSGLALFFAISNSIYAQTTFSWRNNQNPTSGQWNVANYWWNGSGAALPGGAEILFLDGSVGLNMTNDLPSTNRYRIIFGAGGSSRNVNGTTENTFYDYSNNNPKIENQSSNTQTINFPLKWGYGVVELNPVNGDLTITSYINNNGNWTDVWGGNTNTLIVAGDLSGVGGFTVKNNTNVLFSGAKSYTGHTYIDAGTVEINDDLASSTITIASGAKPRINGDNVDINNLTINSGGVLEILPGKSLTVNGTLTNNAENSGIVIKSGGSLIHSTADVPGTMEREVANADWTNGLDGWHLLSSPVENQLLANGGFTTDPYDFYAWDEVTNIWLNQKEVTNNITAFVPGKGYLVSYDAGGTKTFAGEFNVGNQAFTNLTKTGDFWFTGFHLLGNPFASAIKWNDGNWVLSNISTVASVWDEVAQNYLSRPNANDIIPANQGFFVHAGSATNAITIPAAARTHSTTPFYKSANADVLKFRITNSANETYDETVIRLNPAATLGYDQEFDGYKLFGSSTAPQLFTYFSPDEYVSVNTLPLDNMPDFVEIGLRPGAETTHTISSVENTMNRPVMLEDRFTGTFIVLGENTSYDFSAKPGDSEVRFILHFSGTVGTENDLTTAESPIYSYQNIIYVKNAPANSTIALTSITGQVLMRTEATGSGLTTLNAEKLPKGVYIVSLIAGGKQISRKVVL